MIAVIKEVRRQVAFKRLFRQQQASYSFVDLFPFEKFVRTYATFGSQLLRLESTRKEIIRSAVSKCQFRTLFSSAATASSVEHDDDNIVGSMDVAEFEEITFDHSVETEIEDDLAHLKIKLYEVGDSKTDRYIEKLYDSASIQQVFDVVEECEQSEGRVNLKVASQALVTIWDLQKLLFKISANFDPERDYFDKPSFIDKVSRHPVFLEKIVKPVVQNCELLEDEPLLATLLCLKRMNYDMRGEECQKFVEECVRRSETLSLPSVSRLFVCMRTESLYGMFVCAKFYPLLSSYIDKMSSDLDVRLIAISLRNTLRITSNGIIDKFRTKIEALVDDFSIWETVTLCKVFLLLIACRNVGNESKHVFELVAKELISRIPNMQLMDLFSLQPFLERGFIHPYGLVDALVNRMMRIVQEGVSSSVSPRLDLLASIAPHLKSVEQRRQLSVMLEDYLNNHSFELASGILFTILRWSKSSNVKLHNLFWNKAAEMVTKQLEENVFDRRVLKMGREYVSFIYGLSFGYRHRNFEFIVKRYLYRLMDNYSKGAQPCLINPGDFSRSFAFLIGCASLNDPIFYDIEMLRTLDDFAPQFRSSDLVILSRGLESVIMHLFYQKRPTAKYYDRILEICSILEEQCSRILIEKSQQEVGFGDLLAIHKSALVTRRVKGESPILDVTMQKMLQSEINDARSIKDLAQHLLNGWNYYPEANKRIEDFIWNLRNTSVSPELIEKFVVLAFCVGWDTNNEKDVFGFCGDVLTKDWEKLTFLGLLQASLGLCFYRRLTKELVENIFSVEFLDQLDAELTSTFRSNHYPLRLRQAMMELNRAVCLDMPDVNLPWFHEKFCEELFSMNKPQETYMHKEVRKALAEVVGDDAAVQANICSPYYYNIDFLIEFDQKSRPIKRNRRNSVGFFRKFKENPESLEVGRKVAVLVLSPSSFTKSVRNLKGQVKLRRRHLEILGYDVIEIDPIYWNSMFMSENVVRHNFLESQLYARAKAIG